MCFMRGDILVNAWCAGGDLKFGINDTLFFSIPMDCWNPKYEAANSCSYGGCENWVISLNTLLPELAFNFWKDPNTPGLFYFC